MATETRAGEPGDDINATNRHGWTKLHDAASYGRDQEVKRLLQVGADIHACNEDQCTPLHLAVFGGHLGTVRLLLEKGANPNAKARFAITPLHFARTHAKAYATADEIRRVLEAHDARTYGLEFTTRLVATVLWKMALACAPILLTHFGLWDAPGWVSIGSWVWLVLCLVFLNPLRDIIVATS